MKTNLLIKRHRKDVLDWKDTIAALATKPGTRLKDKTSGSSGTQIISFFLNGTEYAVELRDAFEVIKPGKITRVPRTPDFIAGILHVRGEIIAVMDLKKRLGIAVPEAATSAAKLLVAGKKGATVGLLVDKLGEINGFQKKAFERVAAEGPFLQGKIRVSDRVIVLLDMERLLDFSITGAPEKI